jgi:hypothetical protein
MEWRHSTYLQPTVVVGNENKYIRVTTSKFLISFPAKVTTGLEPISYRGALLSTPLHATV